MRYPKAVWVPWLYPEPDTGRPTYYRGLNRPTCVVIHTMAGWASTAIDWANSGQYPKSWHFTVSRNGVVYQHLDFSDGGYHAGITVTQGLASPPGWYLPGTPGFRQFMTWPLWQGPYVNINHYSIGIETEGFPDMDRTYAQEEALYQLCLWLSDTLGLPWHYDYFVPHAVIDRINRVNDFDYPRERTALYSRMNMPGDPLEENYMGMTPKELARVERLERLIAGWGVTVLDLEANDPGTFKKIVGEEALVYADEIINWSALENFNNLNLAVMKRDNHFHETGGLVATGPAQLPYEDKEDQS